MSYRTEEGKIVIEDEPKGICDLCGETAETRPYGPDGKNICVPCGMKDPQTTFTNMGIKLGGMNPKEAKELADFMILLRDR